MRCLTMMEQNRNKNFSLLAIVLNWAPCRPVWSSPWGEHLQGMVRRKVGRAGAVLLLRREVFLHFPSLLWDSSLICALGHKELCWLTWHSFAFHCKSLPCLLSSGGSGSPYPVSFSEAALASSSWPPPCVGSGGDGDKSMSPPAPQWHSVSLRYLHVS